MRGSQVESLTYYSSQSYELGMIIKIPLRKKEVSGLVIGRESVSAAKTAVRAATFSLRKLPVQSDAKSLPPLIVETARKLAKETPSTIGAVLFSLLPEEVKTGEQVLESSLPCLGTYETPAVSVLQATKDERLRTYRSRVREAFAHRGSVLLVVPASAYLEQVTEVLSTGIEDRVVVLSSSLSARKLQRGYQMLQDTRQAKLIVTTPSHAFIERHDITDIIIEHSRSLFYKSRMRPYIDHREALLTLAKFGNRQVLLGDLLPRSEDEHRRREDLYQTEGEQPKRLAFPSRARIVTANEEPTPGEPFALFSKKLLRSLRDNTLSNKKTFVYGARRGLAPVVTCGDCGYVFHCPDSGRPYSLLRTKKDGEEERWFLSSASGRRVRAADTCPDCGSWRLFERGIGVQQIFDELKERFPKEKIILFDHTTATTPRKIRSLLADFYDSKRAILVGTSMVLPYLDKPIPMTVVPSLDAARSIPTWRADEEFFGLMLAMREITSELLLIQTRQEPDDLVEYVKNGLVERFYDDEIELRESLQYPPFSVFVHLTIMGSAESLVSLEETILETLKDFNPHFYSAPLSTAAKTIRYALIRVPADSWPDKNLLEALRSLPPVVRVEINPAKIV